MQIPEARKKRTKVATITVKEAKTETLMSEQRMPGSRKRTSVKEG
jgi:hypothetical protein